MRDTIEKAKNLFGSIICLRAEGIEFFSQKEILDSIMKEACKGYDLCKEALQQSVEADYCKTCSCPNGYNINSAGYCSICGGKKTA
ncbi:MAG: hypothetical protein AMK71_04165 [Nitrospira bacterium SG8_35_4]|nr:MAG: hypothetical protein AMK71_04165 [Nitrospira bacterium SG8_35_4]